MVKRGAGRSSEPLRLEELLQRIRKLTWQELQPFGEFLDCHLVFRPEHAKILNNAYSSRKAELYALELEEPSVKTNSIEHNL